MKYLLSTCCIIFATSSFNAYGMMPEESEEKDCHKKNLSRETYSQFSEDALQNLTTSQENAIRPQAISEDFQDLEEAIRKLQQQIDMTKDLAQKIGTKTEGIHKKNEEEDKTEKDYKAELEKCRKTANLFISNYFNISERNPLKPHLGIMYEPKDDKKKVDHRLDSVVTR